MFTGKELINMKKMEQLYEGKAKKVFKTDDENLYIVDYKDDATAFNGLKKGQIAGKGVVNNKMSNFLMQIMEKNGIPTHFVDSWRNIVAIAAGRSHNVGLKEDGTVVAVGERKSVV